MDEKSGWSGFFSRSQKKAVIGLAREEFGIVADIRGLSYGANFHTAEIFNRIVLDKGELTESYVAELNHEVPLVEEQFNKRANLYTQLEDVSNRMHEASVNL